MLLGLEFRAWFRNGFFLFVCIFFRVWCEAHSSSPNYLIWKFHIIWNIVTHRLPHLPRHLTCKAANSALSPFTVYKFIISLLWLPLFWFFSPAFNKLSISTRWMYSFAELLFQWCCWKTQQPPDGQINVTVLLQWLKTEPSSRGGCGALLVWLTGAVCLRLSRFSLANTHPLLIEFSLLDTLSAVSQRLVAAGVGYFTWEKRGQKWSLLAFINFLSEGGCISM